MSCHGAVRGKDGGDIVPQHHLHGTTTDSRSGLANPWHEEPDAGATHVRICGSRGRVTALGHPGVPSMFDSLGVKVPCTTSPLSQSESHFDVAGRCFTAEHADP